MSDVIDRIIAFEQDELDDEQTISLFQELIDTGQVWHLQGAYGRSAVRLVEAGLCTLPDQDKAVSVKARG
ncbi:hypothetical protein [Rhodococcus phage REQ1]|uniref:hypothetical protein n=1 Tax=Rhodococcus phage REQ1 TaxID=1109712 RepID=UPI00023EEBE8|nr:hypothetical protein RoPhREQ1_gp07 [Rhodococcus phage REQ1]AEV52003.1 hypothetical protein [Rhodococcus phage REQ1]